MLSNNNKRIYLNCIYNNKLFLKINDNPKYQLRNQNNFHFFTKSSSTKQFCVTNPIINQTNTLMHNHYRYDGLNDIKFNKYSQKEIVKRENDIFKSWKKMLNHYYNDWDKAVNSFSIQEKKDFGEIIGEYKYFEETSEEGYDILLRTNIKTNKKEIVLDLKKIPFLIDINKTVLKGLRISSNNKKVSFVVDLENNERYTGGIYDIEERCFENIQFENVNCIEFTKFENYYIIIENDTKNRPSKIKGVYSNNSKEDSKKSEIKKGNKEVILFEEKDDKIFLETAPSKDNKFLLINSMTKNDTAIFTLDLTKLEAKPVEILKRNIGIKYFTDHANDKFFILSNLNYLTKENIHENDIDQFIKNKLYKIEKNKNFKLFCLEDKYLNTENLNTKLELIANPQKDEVFEDMDILNDYVVVYLKKCLIPTVLVHNITKKENKIIQMQEVGELKPRLNKDFYSKKVEFEFSNPYIFKNIYELALESSNYNLNLIDSHKFSKGKLNKNDFILNTIMAPALDGETIPITLFHKKNILKNRKNKLLLVAYGAYGLNLDIDFNSVFLAAVAKMGFIVAFCHIRGGSEKGINWHLDGKLLNKHNSVSDFFSCISHLIQEGYSHPNYISAYGQSAGGIVVGQAINLKPDLFRAVVLSHPFVDVLSTLLDDKIPLTIPDYEEFGNPIKNKEDYLNILSYSPYENISHQEYPAIYISMSLDDPRVPYWGVLKYIEKIRQKAKTPKRIPEFTDKNICVKIYDSGHFGPVNKNESLKEKIWEMMWLDKMLLEKDNFLI